uniref:Uncharacterized protein n=1 Tax=Rhizophora mucronata TaxID=61149 RepID=A0A2P2QZA2_RHIMU
MALDGHFVLWGYPEGCCY